MAIKLYFYLSVLLIVFVQQVWMQEVIASETNECSFGTSAEASRRFAYSLYQSVTKPKKSFNIFLAPKTVASALSMILPGAKGRTKSQIWSGLKFDNTTLPFLETNIPCLMRMYNNDLYTTRVEDRTKDGITTSSDEKTIVINTANKLFMDNTFEIDSEFLKETNKYGAGIEKLDFTYDTENTRDKINNWVTEKTEDKIQDLFNEGSITPETRLAIVSAIYFKGLWKYPFLPRNAQRSDFIVNKDKTVRVDFLMKTRRYKTKSFPDLGLDMLELPYEDEKFGRYNVSMILMKPRGTIEEAEKSLNEEELGPAIKQLLSSDGFREIEVTLPKFKITAEYKLRPILRSMGIKHLFNPGRADLSGMRSENATDNRPLNVNAAIHKTFIEVDEKGTEAAGATGLAFTPLMLPQRFQCNKPFLFMIYEKNSDGILFIGKVNNPKR